MRFTRAGAHALEACVFLARRPGLVKSRVLGRHCRMSPARISRVLRPLTRAGLVYAVSGPHGGFRLARPADEVTVLEVLEHVDGPLAEKGWTAGAALVMALRGLLESWSLARLAMEVNAHESHGR